MNESAGQVLDGTSSTPVGCLIARADHAYAERRHDQFTYFPGEVSHDARR
jgi:hypothetical protein